MKNKFAIFALSFILIAGIGFVIYNPLDNNLITGLAIDDDTNQTFATKEQAISAINESRGVIEKLKENNFSIVYAGDKLIEAEKAFKQAEYSEILRGEVNASSEKRAEALKALQSLNLKNITYDNVLIYTDKINSRLDEAFVILDSIGALKTKIEEDYKKSIEELKTEESVILLNEARIAFYDDRYDDANSLLSKSKENLELEISSIVSSGILNKNALNFFARNWKNILIFAIFFGILGCYLYRKIGKNILKKRIRKMKLESRVLVELIKKAQTERFNENKISGLVYNTRVNKYKKRIQEIKEILPVFEERLRKISGIKMEHK